MAESFVFEQVALDRPEAAAALAGVIAPLVGSDPNACLDHDPTWLMAPPYGDAGRTFALLARRGGQLVAYAAFTRKAGALPFSVGEKTLFRYPIEQIQLTSGDLVDPAADRDRPGALSRGLFAELAGRMQRGQLAFLQGVPVGSSLHRAVQPGGGLDAHFHVMPYGAPYSRRLIELPESLDAYLKQLGKGTRATLRKTRRRLEAHVDGAIRMEVYTAPDSIDTFLEVSEAVSRKTYQWQLLERGMKDQERFAAVLRNAAENRWMRCYTYHCGDEPVAFMVGYLSDGWYYSTDIGYDPAWGSWSVGNVMHCDVIDDLITCDEPVRRFDFMGDTANHQRLSNGHQLDQANYYLFPRTLEGTVLAFGLRAVDGLSVFVGRTLDRLGIKTRIRRWLRERAAGGPDEKSGRDR